ncbi:MAG: Clp protease N-terminal domain-containing protein [Phycisphaeraceae bacterium]
MRDGKATPKVYLFDFLTHAQHSQDSWKSCAIGCWAPSSCGETLPTAEHFLLALLESPDSRPARALAALGVTRAAVLKALGELS